MNGIVCIYSLVGHAVVVTEVAGSRPVVFGIVGGVSVKSRIAGVLSKFTGTNLVGRCLLWLL